MDYVLEIKGYATAGRQPPSINFVIEYIALKM